jgi:glycosyltransferase involved in cell wall biosynthesis
MRNKLKLQNLPKRLLVLFVSLWYPYPENPFFCTFVEEQVKAVSLFNEVYVIAPAPSDRFKWFKLSKDIEEEIPVLRIYYPVVRLRYLFAYIDIFMRLLSITIGLVTLLKKQKYKPHIIHAIIFPTLIPAFIFANYLQIPLILTEHWGIFLRKRLNTWQTFLLKLLLNRATAITTVSNALKEIFEKIEVDTPIYIVPNTVNVELFSPSIQTENGEKAGMVNIVKILFVGRLEPVKGLDILLKTLAELKNKYSFILNIIGDGSKKKEYEQLTEKLSLNNRVVFHGSKDRKEVANFIKQCDFLALTSYSESFACVLLEAAACGKPFIATDVGGIKDIANEKCSILVKPGNFSDIKTGLEIMFNKHRKFNSNKIRELAMKYSYESVGFKFNKIYRGCLV